MVFPAKRQNTMHRQKSKRTLKSLRLGAVHFLFNIVLALSAIGITTAGLIIGSKPLMWTGTAAIILFLFSGIVFFLSSQSWHCPLCMGKLWAKSGCRKHRNARRAFGTSYRLRIALRVIACESYRCPYCGEPFSTRKTRK